MSGTGRTRRATGPTYSRPTSWPSAGCVISIHLRASRPTLSGGGSRQPSTASRPPPAVRTPATTCGATASTAAGTSCRGTGCTSRRSSASSGTRLEDETWALPYWYSIDPDDPGKAAVPPAFLDMTLNDNNLETSERSQTARSGLPFYGDIDPVQVGETVIATLSLDRYATPSGQATFGGGERADLSFDGGERGSLENVPHGAVHSLVGNDYDEAGNVVNAGWMGSFYTAGLDPLFWLHHANIDRLWEVWLKLDPAHVNPTGDPAFLDTTFTFPDPESGSVTWSVGEVLDTEFLGYVYESLDAPSVLAPPAPPTPPTPAPPNGEPEDTRSASTEGSMPRPTPPQVLGAASEVSLASPEPVAMDMEPPSATARSGGGARTRLPPGRRRHRDQRRTAVRRLPERARGGGPARPPGAARRFVLHVRARRDLADQRAARCRGADGLLRHHRPARAARRPGPVGRRAGADQLQHRGPRRTTRRRRHHGSGVAAARPDVRARRIAILVD